CKLDPGDLMRDLRERRLHALPVRVYTNPHFEPAVRGYPHRCLIVSRDDWQAPGGKDAGTVRRLLAIRGKADADAAPIRLASFLAAPPGLSTKLFASELQALLIIAAVVVLPRDIVVRHRRRRNEVLVTDFERIAPHLPCDRIDHQLHCEADAGPRNAAIRQETRLVGRHAFRATAVAAKVV